MVFKHGNVVFMEQQGNEHSHVLLKGLQISYTSLGKQFGNLYHQVFKKFIPFDLLIPFLELLEEGFVFK